MLRVPRRENLLDLMITRRLLATQRTHLVMLRLPLQLSIAIHQTYTHSDLRHSGHVFHPTAIEPALSLASTSIFAADAPDTHSAFVSILSALSQPDIATSDQVTQSLQVYSAKD